MIPVEYAFDENIQLQILAMLVRYPQFVSTHPDVVRPEYFTNPTHQLVAEAYIAKQDGTYYLEPEGLLHLVINHDHSNKQHKSKIKKCIRAIYTKQISDKLIAEESIRFAKHHALIKYIFDAAQNLSELSKTNNFPKLQDDLRKALEVGENIKNDGLDVFEKEPNIVLDTISTGRIPTGYKILDGLLEGGLGVGELGAIAAPPSTGKSIAVQDMAISALVRRKNTTVVIVTLEMSEFKYFRRMYSRITGLPKDEVNKRINDIPRMLKYFQKKTGGRIIVKQFGRAKVRDIEAYVLRLRGKGVNPDILFVDYADLLYPTFNHKDPWINIDTIYKELREVAIELNIPIWTPTQGNRASYNKEIFDINDLAASFGKAMTVDVMVALCRTKDERVSDEARFFLAKNRDNEDKVQIKVAMDFNTYRIRELFRL